MNNANYILKYTHWFLCRMVYIDHEIVFLQTEKTSVIFNFHIIIHITVATHNY